MTVHAVTPNPAVDITYRVPAARFHTVNRVEAVAERPGGKGVNVARLLAARGADVAAYGFLGGLSGRRLSNLLTDIAPGVEQRWTGTESETRRTIAVVDDEDTTMYNEPGRPVSDEEWARLTQAVASAAHPGDTVTISGSLPPQTDSARLAELVAAARERGATVIVDTSGPALLAAARAGAHVLKPNRDELVEVTGSRSVAEGIAALLEQGCAAVVASLGPDGLLLGTDEGLTTATLGRSLQGNPTGAGDAVVAALAHALAGESQNDLSATLKGALTSAVGWSAAAVLAPVAGEIDLTITDGLVAEATTKEWAC